MTQLIVGLVLLLASTVLALLGFFGSRVLRGLDGNVQETARGLQEITHQHSQLSKDFYRLEGKCTANHKGP